MKLIEQLVSKNSTLLLLVLRLETFINNINIL